jgi:predicted Zn-dependent protease
MKPSLTKLGAAIAAITIAACGDISPPNRTADFYGWGLITAGDTLTFNWPASSLPVRIWVEDTLGLANHTAAGIQTWKEQFLYGEWDAVIVDDSATADVVIGFSVTPALRSLKMFSMAPGCSALTSFPPLVGSTITLPFRVRMVNQSTDPTSPQAQSCFAITVAHELGHTMGLFQESGDPNDLMYGIDPTTGPSTRDRNSAQLLYHVTPELDASR